MSDHLWEVSHDKVRLPKPDQDATDYIVDYQAVEMIFGQDTLNRIRGVQDSYPLIITCPFQNDRGTRNDPLYDVFRNRCAG